MSYQLVIAEKPSVARSIAGVIGADKKQDGYMVGNGYLVSWCIGHLVSLADAGTYDERFKKWRYDDLPILPQEWQYIIPDDKKKQFDTLRSLMERPDVTGLVCATDAGREGELIFRFVYQMAGCKKPFQRLWISSMEDAAIQDGFAHLKPGADYDNLYQSALCRAQADWLVGINATRLFSILYHKTLTVGRVQTPTLKMLVDREAKINSFQKEKYHIVQIAAGGMEAASERMGNADDAKVLKAACETAQAVCVSVTREKKTEQPPRLYDLTTLQREANRLFGFTAKQTLDYLYNAKREKSGITVCRGEIIPKGLYHLSVSAWIVNQQGQYLLSQRHPKKQYPLYWECTGGSVLSGETSLQGAIREVKEELGILLTPGSEKLIYQTIRENVQDFYDVWLFHRDIKIEEMRLQETEVVDVQWVSSDKLFEMFRLKQLHPLITYVDQLIG